MALTDWIRSPDLSTTPPTVYHATIRTGKGNHVFVFHVVMRGIRGKPEVSVISNEQGFQMPEWARFQVEKTASTEFGGQKAALKYLVPISDDETGDGDVYTPPDALLGRYIPEIEHQEGEVVPLKEIAYFG